MARLTPSPAGVVAPSVLLRLREFPAFSVFSRSSLDRSSWWSATLPNGKRRKPQRDGDAEGEMLGDCERDDGEVGLSDGDGEPGEWRKWLDGEPGDEGRGDGGARRW